MFIADQYRAMYDRFMGNLAQPVTFKINNGTGFDDGPTVDAHVSAWREQDLVSGATIKLGDLKLIIPDDGTLPTLGLKDRIEIEGRSYAIIHWDANTRSLGDKLVAIQVTVRG